MHTASVAFHCSRAHVRLTRSHSSGIVQRLGAGSLIGPCFAQPTCGCGRWREHVR